MNKNLLIGIIVLILIIGGISYKGFKSNVGKLNTDPQVSGASVAETPVYFADDASAMYFYQDTCSWCIKEKPILEQLGNAGYRFKSMNIGSNYPNNQKWWQDYKISGTPTFIAKNGDRLEGFQDYDKLKSFMDLHK